MPSKAIPVEGDPFYQVTPGSGAYHAFRTDSSGKTPDDQNPGYYSVGTTPPDRANIDNYLGSPADALTPDARMGGRGMTPSGARLAPDGHYYIFAPHAEGNWRRVEWKP
jgi:hypothetical protein